MEQNVGLVVFKHLRHKLNVHVLDIDVLLRVSGLDFKALPKLLIVPEDSCSTP
jgi:hypothetical protein